jgi:hypothetical protein
MWCPGKVQLANSMTKRGASGIELLNVTTERKIARRMCMKL